MSIRIPRRSSYPVAFPPPSQGQVEFEVHESEVLRGNPAGDPYQREIAVYRSPGSNEGVPLLVLLAGFTGSGTSYFPVRSGYLQESFAQRFERLSRQGRLTPTVVVAPDATTALGGSQYLNSTATGRYEDYIMDEILPWAQQRYQTDPVGVLGHSSGGFGALTLGLRHPDRIRAVLASSPDSAFEFCYLSDIPKAIRVLREMGGPEAFLDHLFRHPTPNLSPTHPFGITLNLLAMAACYSPVPQAPGEFELPFDWDTGEIRSEIWSRWIALDPAEIVRTPEAQEALASMRGLWVGAGTEDEWFLDVGVRRVASRLGSAQRIPLHTHFFRGGHFDAWPQMVEECLPEMVRALSQNGDAEVRKRA